MRKRKASLGATPRGKCPVCNYCFDDATDREFHHRWNYHVTMSVRHQKYLALKGPVPFITRTSNQAGLSACR